jgi:cell division protein ZapA
MNGDKLTIRVNIANRTYPLTIYRSEEEAIRKVVKEINNTIINYTQRYPNKDTEDYLSMTLLQFAIQHYHLQQKNNIEPIITKLETLNNELQDFLVQEQVL